MEFAKKVWRLLVGIKDGLSLLFLLLFFTLIFAGLTARPTEPSVTDGALLITLNGTIVEESKPVDPLEMLLAKEAPEREYAARDIIRALNLAAADDRINSVVIDLEKFGGGGMVHLEEIGTAIETVKKAKKPVFVHGIFYDDDAVLLASHASEAWIDPYGGGLVTGPGGAQLYFAGLLEKLNINVHIYKVGKYKAAVEPFIRSDMSDEARENASALYGALWENWQDSTKKARPAFDLAALSKDPAAWVEQNKGDLAKAALQIRMIDKIGDRIAFGKKVASVAGEDPYSYEPGSFAATSMEDWLAANPEDNSGEAIGVITIAGDIIDGENEPGMAGGERIAGLLDQALESDLKGLVIRVDSPGGSVFASEQIRQAILRHKERKIPIAVSMANVAASGGYWVSTPADRIFAQPNTITGSIGIFGIIPTVENAATKLGIATDGVKTTSLSGQPDFVTGFNPEIDRILQSTIENGYDRFLTLVSASRKISKEKADSIGQGRVWDGGTARQIGLVDELGGIDDALAWTAKKAGLEEGEWHPLYLSSAPDEFDTLLQGLVSSEGEGQPASDLFAQVSLKQQAIMNRAMASAEMLMSHSGMMAYCTECAAVGGSQKRSKLPSQSGWLNTIAAFLE